jgi:IS30 family transposase
MKEKIEILIKKGYNDGKIAKKFKRHHLTIYCELNCKNTSEICLYSILAI